jgi:hypothetical protein
MFHDSHGEVKNIISKLVPLRFERAEDAFEVELLRDVDLVMRVDKVDFVGGGDVGRTVVVAAPTSIEVVASAVLPLLDAGKTLLQLDLEDQVDSHHLLLRKLVAVVVVPVAEGVALPRSPLLLGTVLTLL